MFSSIDVYTEKKNDSAVEKEWLTPLGKRDTLE